MHSDKARGIWLLLNYVSLFATLNFLVHFVRFIGFVNVRKALARSSSVACHGRHRWRAISELVQGFPLEPTATNHCGEVWSKAVTDTARGGWSHLIGLKIIIVLSVNTFPLNIFLIHCVLHFCL